MRRKKAIVTVTNDLFTDQRVDKICRYLVSRDVDVLLVGRKLKNSRELLPRVYATHRMNLKFTKGAAFYAEYNFRLFFFLLFQKFDFLVSNDLDTLPACDFAASAKGKKLVYDSHEYFTEVPELQHRKIVKKVWEVFEIMIFRNLKRTYTVNDSIASIYNRKYRMQFKTVKNFPEKIHLTKTKSRADLGLPGDKHILILQGAGINIQRGAEELTDAMYHLEHCFLVIIGSGDVFPVIRNKIQKNKLLSQRILIADKLPYPEMMQYTLNADLGFSIDKNTNPNYYYSLPNKIFDYIKAGVPVVATNLAEISKVIQKYEVGEVIEDIHPEKLALFIQQLLSDKLKLEKYKANCKRASEELCWENQLPVLDEIYKGLI